MRDLLFSPKTLLAFLIGALIFGSRFVFSFTEPSSTPPFNNTPAPLNVSSTGQSKAGGLILNTGGAVNGLIVDKGNVGIGTTNPSQRLDVNGSIRASGGTPIYQCPEILDSQCRRGCVGQLSTNSTCTDYTAFGGGCQNVGTKACTLVGRLVAP